MTIRNFEYFKYISDGFKEIDNCFYHFCLIATKETIYKRLIQRGEQPGAWVFEQTDGCIENFLKYDFREYIDTDEIGVNDIVKIILERIKQKNDV